METKHKNFTEDLAQLRKFLADRKLLGELATRSGAKSRTVQYTFCVKSESELTGKKLKVFLTALALKKEIEDVFSRYDNVDDCRLSADKHCSSASDAGL